MAIELSQVIPWGRSFDEYRRMFDLRDADLAGNVLGCADGPASFNTQATAMAMRVVSCDPIYAFTADEIRRRIQECYDDLIKQLRKDRDGFVWTDFTDPDHLGRCRLEAMNRFLADFEIGKTQDRYVAASLPNLPFAPRQFDLALVSHFLLLYSEQLDLEFHIASIRELLRVAAQVRIFPLLTLDRRRSEHLDALLGRFNSGSCRATIRPVPYEFQRGGNEMLVVEPCQ